MRIKNNQKLKSEILLLSRETGSNTGYNRYRTLFSTGYSGVVESWRKFYNPITVRMFSAVVPL